MSIMTEFFKKKFEGRNTKLIAWQHFFANEITMKNMFIMIKREYLLKDWSFMNLVKKERWKI
jgi:hypothetical protein